MLAVKNLCAGYSASTEIVHNISFTLEDGQFDCIIGANGCGKTTTLKTILGLLHPLGGDITLDGISTASMNERELARHFAYIPQMHRLPFPFKVKDVVLMGRTPHMPRMASVSRKDRIIAYAALSQLEIVDLANKSYAELSGGQQQLVLIARALAQQPDILVMDEPTASLDFGNQQLVLSKMRSLVDSGMSVLMVTHDPAHAFYCADSVVVLHEGHILTEGAPEDVITSEVMKTIYNTDVHIEKFTTGKGSVRCACVPIVESHDPDERLIRILVQR